MITFDLLCTAGHRFEGWFGSSDEYARQSDMGLLICPACGDQAITKAVTAPYIGRKGNQAQTLRPQQALVAGQGDEIQPVVADVPAAPAITPPVALPPELVEKMAAMQSAILKSSDYVGGDFADNARAIHYGEAENRLIHGETTPDQAQELHEEGIAIMPLPFPVIAPNQKN